MFSRARSVPTDFPDTPAARATASARAAAAWDAVRARPPSQRVNYAALGRGGCSAAASPHGADWALLWPGRAARGDYLGDARTFAALGCGGGGEEEQGAADAPPPFVVRVLRGAAEVAAAVRDGGGRGGGGGGSAAVHDLLRVSVHVWRGGALEPSSALLLPAPCDAAAWGSVHDWPGVEATDADARGVVGYVTSATEEAGVAFVRADAAAALVAATAGLRARWHVGRGAAAAEALVWTRVLVQGPRSRLLRPAELCFHCG